MKRFCSFLLTAGVLLIFYSLSIAVQQVGNDECATATVVPGLPFVDSLDTRLATNNPADPRLSCNSDGDQTDGNTVWYVWTPTGDLTVNLNTLGSGYDTALGVFTGTCDNLVEVECSDSGVEDELVFSATGGVTYFIKVGEFLDGSGGGGLVLNLGESDAKAI